ncbi:MAG: PIN domain-containing protein [Chitinophagaceae bacterium]|nr:PIN domain-containing protein [Anaerolineae bacterium]
MVTNQNKHKKILVDSSFLYALLNPREAKHENAMKFVQTSQAIQVIPDVVLTEVAFLFNRFGGTRAVIVFLESLEAAQPELEPVILADIKLAREIMLKYPGAKLDFVDCSIMALAGRLEITQICTFDRRDFSIYRPDEGNALELLP